MRNHRVPAILFTITLILTMMIPGTNGPVAAQDTPIEPVAGGDGPAEITVAGQRYVRDLNVPADLTPMQSLTDDSGVPVFSKPGGSDPLQAVYVPLDDGSGLLTRYYPEFVGAADAVCPVEQADAGTLSGNGATYVSAGPELDFTSGTLQEAGTTGDGAVIYRLPDDEALANLFVAQNNGQGPNSLIRYVQQASNGAPSGMDENMTFAGQQFTSSPGADASLDGLVRVGCAGLFPVYAATPEQPFTLVAIDVAGQTVAFTAVAGEQPAASPTELPGTPAATAEAGTPAPTADSSIPVPTTEPTLEPTAPPTIEPTIPPTPEPTTEPTLEPTQEPTPEPTAEPTLEPTVAPTTEPTAEPTTEPSPAPTEEATAAPTIPPTPEPTAAPTTEPTVAADADLGEEPEALPTEVPPTPAPGTVVPTLPPARPTPTPRPLQPQAVVPTLPPDAPSPAAGRSDVIACAGDTGEVDANGVPSRLPRNLQYGGTAYRYSGQVAFDEAGDVTATGCVGAFVLYEPAAGSGDTGIYLGLMNSTSTLFVFEQTASLTVSSQSQVDQQPRSLELGPTEDQGGVRYRAADPWQRSIYSSLSLEVYVEDPEAGLPNRFMGYSIGFDVFGEYALEGEAEGASQEVVDRAESLGVHQEVVIEGQRYVLVALWTPFGTTTNGWLTLYSVDGEDAPDRLVGLDPRSQGLSIFNAEQ